MERSYFGSAYVCCYAVDGEGDKREIYVLRGRKRFVQTRDKLAKAMGRCMVVNNPGMSVFPGGGVNTDYPDAAVSGGLKEFYEETGVLIRLATTPNKVELALGVFDYTSTKTFAYNDFRKDVFFMAVYIDMGSLDMLNALRKIIQPNLIQTANLTESDELESVTVVRMLPIHKFVFRKDAFANCNSELRTLAQDTTIDGSRSKKIFDAKSVWAVMHTFTPPLQPTATEAYMLTLREMVRCNYNFLPFCVFGATYQWTKAGAVSETANCTAVLDVLAKALHEVRSCDTSLLYDEDYNQLLIQEGFAAALTARLQVIYACTGGDKNTKIEACRLAEDNMTASLVKSIAAMNPKNDVLEVLVKTALDDITAEGNAPNTGPAEEVKPNFDKMNQDRFSTSWFITICNNLSAKVFTATV